MLKSFPLTVLITNPCASFGSSSSLLLTLVSHPHSTMSSMRILPCGFFSVSDYASRRTPARTL